MSFLIFCKMRWKVHIKHVRGYWRMMVSEKNTFVIELCVELATFFMGLNFSWKNNQQSMVIQILVFGRHFLKKKKKKRMKQACLFKESNWQYLLPMIKFKLSNENWNFGKLVFVIISLTAFQYLKTFFLRFVVILTNMMFWYYIIKSVKMWKIWITQWSHIFQMDDQYMML